MTARKSTAALGAERALLAELEGVYRELDTRFAGWACPESTECCRFGLTGVEPYVTSIEYLAVLTAIHKRGGPLHAKRRAQPLAERSAREERTCALLDRDGRCSIYAARPLGCRTYFCSRAHGAATVQHSEVLAMVRRIQEIAARHTPGGELSHRLGKMMGV
jgi:Fe-S-cluster containining protein